MNIKNLVIGIAIIILTALAIGYGIVMFYDAPEYEDFCIEEIRVPTARVAVETVCPSVCIEMYDLEENECDFDECGSGCGADGITTFETLEECNTALFEKGCYDEYDLAREIYQRNIFLIALPIGIALIIVGIAVFGLEVVGAGLAGGGIIIILWGITGYWRYGSDLLKFSLSLIGLVAVIWLAYWFNKKK